MNESKKRLKVLILSCSTGEGHNSAAKAIEASLRAKNVECETRDALKFKSEKASLRVAGLYNAVIKKVPLLFGFVYNLGKLYDGLRLPTPVYAANARYADKLYSYVRDNGFNCVICTHLFAMQAITAVKNKYCLFFVKCYGVLTDYTAIPFYRETALDGYFVPTDEVRAQLVKKGIPSDRIFCTGIPVHPKFNLNITKEKARRSLNLPSDGSVVAVLTGGAGCGKVVKLCRKLNKALDGEATVAVLTGRNGRLAAKLKKIFGGNSKFRTVEFTPDVHIWLKAADVAVSKAGGLSSTEAAVVNVPLVHLKAIPGVETANLKYFSRNGLSLRAGTVNKAVKHTVSLLKDGVYADVIRKLQRFVIGSSASEDIVRKITGDMNYGNFSLDGIYSGGISCGQRDVLPNYPEADCA